MDQINCIDITLLKYVDNSVKICRLLIISSIIFNAIISTITLPSEKSQHLICNTYVYLLYITIEEHNAM